MDDANIVQLYWDRNEQAIPAQQTSMKATVPRLPRTYWATMRTQRNA